MTRTLLIGDTFCAVTEDGKLVEYIPADPADQCGDVLLGRIDRMMPGLNCAFVNVGRKKDGFLPLTEDSGSFIGGKLCSGDMPVVQIRKEEKGDKGVFLTRDITLPGRYVILMPMNRHIGVSGRITDNAVRERLKQLGRAIAGERFGMVMRLAAADAAISNVRDETEEQYRKWLDVKEKSLSAGRAGSVLIHGSVSDQLKADYASRGIDTVIETDALPPELKRQLELSGKRTVPLPGGGNIIIDRCEAMTVIDVNTASSTGTADKAHTVLETDLEACSTISEQIRLRNLSGIILIDFIDLPDENGRKLVMEMLEGCFSNDRIKTVIHGWTSLGLMEMTRKRTRQELGEKIRITAEEGKAEGA